MQQTEWHVRRNVLVHAQSLRLPRTTRTAWRRAHPSAAPLSGTGAHGQRLCQWQDSPRRVATTAAASVRRCRCRRRYRRRCCRHRKEKSPPGMSPLGLQPPHPPTTGARIRPTTATDVSKQRRPLVPAPRACPPAKPFQARTHNAHRLISTCADHHTENHQSSLAAGSTPDSRRTVPQPARREPAQ